MPSCCRGSVMVEVPGRHAHPGVVPRLPESAGPRPLLPSQPFAGPRGAYPGAGEGPLLRLSQRQTKGRSGFKAPGPRVAPSGHAVTRRRSVTAPQSPGATLWAASATRRASGDTRAGRVGAVPWPPGSRAGPRRGARPACLNAGSCTRLEQDLGLRPLTRSRRTWAVALRLNEQALARGSAASPQAKTRPAGKRGIRREWAWQAVMLQDDTCRGKDKPEPLLVQVSGRARMRRPSIEAQECMGALRARERGCPLASRAKGVTGASASVMGLAGTGRARHQRSSCSSGQQQLPQAVNRRSLGSGGLHGFHASTSHSGPPDEAQSARLAQLV
ncbi:MAG: hypothetical protein K0R62_6173, partial [Nonomuraea muscovyensis]|nr:hypothetical protein [Nonomuraea muscovyensis]